MKKEPVGGGKGNRIVISGQKRKREESKGNGNGKSKLPKKGRNENNTKSNTAFCCEHNEIQNTCMKGKSRKMRAGLSEGAE